MTLVDDKEIEANQFAAELMMPASWILPDAREQQIDVEREDDAVKNLAEKVRG